MPPGSGRSPATTAIPSGRRLMTCASSAASSSWTNPAGPAATTSRHRRPHHQRLAHPPRPCYRPDPGRSPQPPDGTQAQNLDRRRPRLRDPAHRHANPVPARRHRDTASSRIDNILSIRECKLLGRILPTMPERMRDQIAGDSWLSEVDLAADQESNEHGGDDANSPSWPGQRECPGDSHSDAYKHAGQRFWRSAAEQPPLQIACAVLVHPCGDVAHGILSGLKVKPGRWIPRPLGVGSGQDPVQEMVDDFIP